MSTGEEISPSPYGPWRWRGCDFPTGVHLARFCGGWYCHILSSPASGILSQPPKCALALATICIRAATPLLALQQPCFQLLTP